jgi:hypothetical protein
MLTVMHQILFLLKDFWPHTGEWHEKISKSAVQLHATTIIIHTIGQLSFKKAWLQVIGWHPKV